jgi:hypothetical protein
MPDHFRRDPATDWQPASKQRNPRDIACRFDHTGLPLNPVKTDVAIAFLVIVAILEHVAA